MTTRQLQGGWLFAKYRFLYLRNRDTGRRHRNNVFRIFIERQHLLGVAGGPRFSPILKRAFSTRGNPATSNVKHKGTNSERIDGSRIFLMLRPPRRGAECSQIAYRLDAAFTQSMSAPIGSKPRSIVTQGQNAPSRPGR